MVVEMLKSKSSWAEPSLQLVNLLSARPLMKPLLHLSLLSSSFNFLGFLLLANTYYNNLNSFVCNIQVPLTFIGPPSCTFNSQTPILPILKVVPSCCKSMRGTEGWLQLTF